jgi:hypothetical protein
MGEAKRRGTLEQRKEESMQRARDELTKYQPNGLQCNQCKSKIDDITLCDTRDIPDLEFACYGYCAKCKCDSWGLVGSQEAIRLFGEFMSQETGETPLMSSNPINKNNSK